MHPSRGAISRFILTGVEIGYPDAVEIHRRRVKRQDIPNTLGRNSTEHRVHGVSSETRICSRIMWIF